MWENALPGRAMERMSIDIVTGEAPPPARRDGALRALALLAGALFLFGLWARGLPAFVAWEVAGDHQRCFGRRHLPARVWSSEPAEVRGWLESRGTPAPPLPKEAGAGRARGRALLPALGPRRRARLLRRRRLGARVGLPAVRPGPHRRRLVGHVARPPRAPRARGRPHAGGGRRERGRRRGDGPRFRQSTVASARAPRGTASHRLTGPVKLLNFFSPRWGCSAVGSAREWHSRGRRFDPGQLHQLQQQLSEMTNRRTADLSISCPSCRLEKPSRTGLGRALRTDRRHRSVGGAARGRQLSVAVRLHSKRREGRRRIRDLRGLTVGERRPL